MYNFLFIGENVWIRLQDMHCPRGQPAVASLHGLLYVLGGRNSKKAGLPHYFYAITSFKKLSSQFVLDGGRGI